MRFPVLTPTEAPQWFSQAFEDAERFYYFALKPKGERNNIPRNEVWVYGSKRMAIEASLAVWPKIQINPDHPLLEPVTLAEALDRARQLGKEWLVLGDGNRNELKRWSVIA